MYNARKDQQLYDEVLHLRKPTVVDELVNAVSKPRGYVPRRGGLPVWTDLRLDAKLTFPRSGPKSELVFSRDKLGRKLWRNPKGKEFDLADPNCYSISYQYESLHDEHLRPYFRRKANNDRVRELGLVNEHGDAICGLEEFNTYRRYLYTVHADNINRERSRQEAEKKEVDLLKKAAQSLEEDIMRQKASCDRVERIRRNLRNVEEAYRRRRQTWLDSMHNHEVRLQEIAEENRAKAIQRARKGQMFNEKVRSRMAHGAEIARNKRVRTVNKRIREDNARRRRLNREAEETKNLKEAELMKYWELKVRTQMEKKERHKQLIEAYVSHMSNNVRKRAKTARRQWATMDDMISSEKSNRLRRNSERNNVWTTDAMVKALTKAWEEERGTITDKDRERIVQAITNEIAECKNKPEGKEVLSLLQEAKRKLDREVDVPEPVTIAVDSLLDKVMHEYVRKNVDKILRSVGEKTLNCAKDLEQIMAQKDNMVLATVQEGESVKNMVVSEGNLRHNKISSQMIRTSSKVPSPSESRMSRLVSFGGIETISTGEAKPQEGLLRSKTRLPTPVPSLTDLVEAVFKEPVYLERDSMTAHDEKKKLDKILLNFSKELLKSILLKAEQSLRLKGAENNFQRKKSKNEIDLDGISDLVTKQILNEEDPKLLESSKIKKLCDRFVQDLVMKKKRSSPVEKK